MKFSSRRKYNKIRNSQELNKNKRKIFGNILIFNNKNLLMISSFTNILLIIIILIFIRYNKTKIKKPISTIEPLFGINNIIEKILGRYDIALPKSNNQKDTKKKLYIKFVDFQNGFYNEQLDIYNFLKERYEVIISDNPDYVIYDIFGSQHLDIEQKYNCVKIFWNVENTVPDFQGHDYLIGVHYMFYMDRYYRKPTNTTGLSSMGSVYNLNKLMGKDFRNKKFCAWVVSNGGFDVRNHFYEKLNQYKTIDMGGSFKNNIGYKVRNKKEFLSDYKFSLCFENSKTDGYISEKLFNAFEAGTIPIYYGDDTILELLNKKSYIHIKDESEFDEKIELIKKIDQDDNLYEKMIKEKIVLDDERYYREEKEYKEFIYHIFDQDKEQAKRFKRLNKKQI